MIKVFMHYRHQDSRSQSLVGYVNLPFSVSAQSDITTEFELVLSIRPEVIPRGTP
jgi:hypothetical protein